MAPPCPLPHLQKKKKKVGEALPFLFLFLFYPEARDQYLHSKEAMALQGFQMGRSIFSKQHENLLHSALLNNILT